MTDPTALVYGVDGPKVRHASIMSLLPRAITNVPAIAMTERAEAG